MAKNLLSIVPYIDKKGRVCARLDKALYGLVQSSRIWYDKLSGILEGMGYTKNPVDPCVYNKMVDGKQITLVVFVDDILASCVHEYVLDQLFVDLKKTFDDIKYKKSADISYIGMRIRVLNGKVGKILLTMDGYVDSMLNEWGNVREYTSSANKNLFEIDESSPNYAGGTERDFIHLSANCCE